MSANARQLADALREIEHLRQRIAALEAAGRGAPARGYARITLARLPAAIAGREAIDGEADQYHLHTASVRLIDLAIDGTWPDGSERVRMRNDGEEEVTIVNPWNGASDAGKEVVLGELPNGLQLILAEECDEEGA